ncbi:Tripartite tricarboxylate transporter TctB family protein [Paracoccus haematequi]|uniref:Tripartite tricarboxylate transporter TctB family protein n=1 Tax=Paracoccus haematequi TaxID=2491866 RepID=A0A447ITC8_9RHOB|nr:tripartite tricarboxylate transporter TctB family protein [Paracoccus haematequi]VDS10705.1 Tripartite tricarboxylate transporter TctB family protein [Paracoccus haematequi]
MTSRLSLSHAALLACVAVISCYITWSAIAASTRLYNLIVVVPVAVIIAVLLITLVWQALSGSVPDGALPDRKSTIGDIIMLVAFGVFCFGLTKFGFDIATFIFVWAGVAFGGERRLWLPPVYAAVFTLALVKFFGSLFPFPMPLLVL